MKITKKIKLMDLLFRFIAIMICVVLGACNSHLVILENDLQKLNQEIALHGKISPLDSSEMEVQRSGIDTLSSAESIQINAFLSSLNPYYPDTAEFIIINYYPGIDDCNSTGTATRSRIGNGIKRFNKAIEKRNQITQLNLFKNDAGIKRWNKNRHWLYDQDLTITKTFFPNHYPCSSYMILHKSGKLYYYYGASWVEKQLKDADLFMNCIRKGYL